MALCYLNYGPYHRARYQHVRRMIERYTICGVQMAREQSEYGWTAGGDDELTTVEKDMHLDQVPAGAWRHRVAKMLEAIQPACCAVAGYSHPSMLAATEWCARRRRPVVLMSDSTAWDAPRTPWKEWSKRKVIAQCAAGFVAVRRTPIIWPASECRASEFPWATTW